MAEHFLVHMNVVRPNAGFHSMDPHVLFFFQQLQEIIAIAKSVEGMRFHNHGARMPDGSYGGLPELTAVRTSRMEDNPHVLTMAGWDDVKALRRFAYKLDLHAEGMKRLRNWVDRSEGATMVMWWALKGSRVSLEEGWDRLQLLRRDGPSPQAFGMGTLYEPPQQP